MWQVMANWWHHSRALAFTDGAQECMLVIGNLLESKSTKSYVAALSVIFIGHDSLGTVSLEHEH
jgi:hypothetical protein